MADNKNPLVGLGIGLGVLIVIIFIANSWLSKQIKQSEMPNVISPVAVPIVEESKPIESALVIEKKVVTEKVSEEKVDVNHSGTESNKIIYEKPLDDVLIVQ